MAPTGDHHAKISRFAKDGLALDVPTSDNSLTGVLIPRQASLFSRTDDALGIGEGKVDIGYLLWAFVATTLPWSSRSSRSQKPYRRQSRGGVLRLTSVGSTLPSGRYPRLALVDWCTQAVQNRNPYVDLGRSLQAYSLNRLGVAIGNSKAAKAEMRSQLLRLKDLHIGYDFTDASKTDALNMVVVYESRFWWDTAAKETSYVRLSTDFYEALIQRPVPLAFNILRDVRSPAEMDCLIWLSYLGYVMSQHRTEALVFNWEQLQDMFGSNYTEIRAFRFNFLRSVKKVAVKYFPGLQILHDQTGLTFPRFSSLVPARRT
jgi:Plasmid encoded RepA protein